MIENIDAWIHFSGHKEGETLFDTSLRNMI